MNECIFRVHNVSQWSNLRHLGESLGGAEGLLEAVSFKKATNDETSFCCAAFIAKADDRVAEGVVDNY